MKRGEVLFVCVIFVLAFGLRVMYLPQRALTFGFDQARDAYTAKEILAGDIKIQGPSASTPGLFHGVLYDYLLVPAYAVSQDPVVAAYWIAFLSCLGVIWVFLLGKDLSGKAGVGMVAALLYAVGFKQVQYGTWLSNPTIAVWLVPLLYLSLWKWLVGERKLFWAVLTGLSLGVVIQSEIFLVYHLPVVVVLLLLARSKVTRGQVGYFVVSGLVGVATIIVSQVKFGMTALSGVSNLFVGPTRPFGYDRLGDYVVLYLNQFGEIFTKDIFPLNEGWGGAWGLVVLISLVGFCLRFKGKKEEPNPYLLMILWLVSHVLVVSLGGVTTPFLTVGLGAAASLGTALVLGRWWERGWKWLVVGLLLIFVGANLLKVAKDNKRGSTLFAVQPDMLLSKQLVAIDYVYQSAGGEKFSINTLTSPLWINTVWAYLFNWYGKGTYGYLAEWHGRDQVGRQGYLPPVSGSTRLYYFIQEPLQGIPPRFVEGERGGEEARSRFLEEKSFGEIVVQKREKKV